MTAAAQRLELVPISRLVESPSNHRKRTWGDMKELTESVKAKGVLQPILARPAKGIGNNLLEIVFGHRRFRAAREAGLDAIPAVVRELSDVEALEANIIENASRADVHPMEEAEGISQLLGQKDKPYTVEEVARKLGKSVSHVYQRLKLLALCAEARKAFYDGTISASVALLVARLPTKELQKDALEKVKPQPWDGVDQVSFREAASIIRDEYLLRLAEAPWKLDDANLVRSAGACSSCPHTSGAQPGLFAELDKKDGNVCTNPPCFKSKREAWTKQRVAQAEATGQEVLQGASAKKALGAGSWDSRATHIRLTDTCHDDPKSRTYAQLLGGKAPTVLAQMEGGELVEAVDKKAARDLLKSAGHKFASEATRAAASSDPAAARERRKQELKRLTVRTAIGSIVARAEERPLDDATVALLAEAILDLAWHDTAVDMANRRGLERKKNERPEEVLEKQRKTMSPAQLRGLVVEALVTRGAYFSYQDGHTDRLKAAAKFYGVDLAKCAAQAKAEIQAKEDAKKVKAPAKGKKTAKAAAARELPRATKEDLADEACLDCGIPAGQPSPGCDACDHPAPASPAKPAELAWREVDGTHRADGLDGEYQVLPGAGARLTWRASWVPKKGGSLQLASAVKLADAKAACQKHAAGKAVARG